VPCSSDLCKVVFSNSPSGVHMTSFWYLAFLAPDHEEVCAAACCVSNEFSIGDRRPETSSIEFYAVSGISGGW
jgi:hypothetical protein